MKSILIIIRTEGDFERAIALGIAAKDDFKLHFVFAGDFSPFYRDGIKNRFQKEIFDTHKFEVKDLSEFNFIGNILRKLLNANKVTLENVRKKDASLISFLLFKVFQKHILKNRKKIIRNMISQISPSYLFTDQSMTDRNYLQEEIRKIAVEFDIPVYLFAHGAAGGLHSEFSDPTYEPYSEYIVCACNTNETKPSLGNRIITGDFSTSYPYVHYLNKLVRQDISFLDDRKYKIGIFEGGSATLTSTSSLDKLMEIIIELSDNKDVAIVLKTHPRNKNPDLRILQQFKNLKIVNSEIDRSRVTKWADIIICNDHSSVVFEPMILGKKVVAVEGKHIPKFKHNHSPLKESSVNFISQSKEFELESLHTADPLDEVTNKIAWGGNGTVDLAKLFLNRLK